MKILLGQNPSNEMIQEAIDLMASLQLPILRSEARKNYKNAILFWQEQRDEQIEYLSLLQKQKSQH